MNGNKENKTVKCKIVDDVFDSVALNDADD